MKVNSINIVGSLGRSVVFVTPSGFDARVILTGQPVAGSPASFAAEDAGGVVEFVASQIDPSADAARRDALAAAISQL